eukprot:2476851-Amphidinium_carterae.1
MDTSIHAVVAFGRENATLEAHVEMAMSENSSSHLQKRIGKATRQHDLDGSKPSTKQVVGNFSPTCTHGSAACSRDPRAGGHHTGTGLQELREHGSCDWLAWLCQERSRCRICA